MTATTLDGPVRTASGGPLTGTGTLLRFMLRRDRVRLPAWTLGIALFMSYAGAAVSQVYSTPESLAGIASISGTPAGAMFGGPAYGYDDLTLDRFLVSRYGLYLMICAGLMGMLTVVRHTRAEERAGRTELIRANVVGRDAQLTAALLLTLLMSVLVAVLISAVMLGGGFDGGGSVLFGASVGAVGLVFGGIAATTVQVFEYPRAASGLAGAVLGASFVLRALGDMASVQGSGPSWLSWLSPIGWSQHTAPYVLDRWWPLVLSVAFAGATAAAGYRLASLRDLDAGLIPPRQGPPHAAVWLRGMFPLVFRLQRAGVIGWSIALLLAGVAYGAFTQPLVDGFADAPEEMVALMGGSENMLAGYLGLMGLMMAFLVSVFAVLAVRSVRAEETSGRAEPVLATAVSRTGWLGGYLAVTALAAAWLLLVSGLGMGAGAAVSTGDAGLLGDALLGHIAHAPAVWLALAVAALLYGAAPRILPAAWVVVGYGIVAGFFAPILDLPDAVTRISPYEHIGEYPLESVSVTALAVITVLAAVLSAAALRVFRRRDLTTTA